MDESRKKQPFFAFLVIGLLVGGGIFFAKHYKVEGLDQLGIQQRDSIDSPPGFDDLMFASAADLSGGNPFRETGFETPTAFAARPVASNSFSATAVNDQTVDPRFKNSPRLRNLRIGSWALSGFGPSKLANDLCRLNLIRTIRQFDVIALQQITASERDLVPRIVEEINESGRIYDFVLGAPTGPRDRPEQLAILFNVDRVLIDRTQTYTVSDPNDQMTYDPLVAWFRAAKPTPDTAWTFTMVNVRVDLGRAPAEVALLPGIFSSVRLDGRGEDDVILAGLFQADDSYLVRKVMGNEIETAVRNSPTDIFGRHQTCNVIVDRNRTSEFLGRGGALDILRLYNISVSEAETISSHLPVFAEFTALEGGPR